MSERELRPAGDTQVLGSVSNAARVLKGVRQGPSRPRRERPRAPARAGKSTTHRLLHTLAVEQPARPGPESGRYRLSATVHELGAPGARRRPGRSQPGGRQRPRQEGSR